MDSKIETIETYLKSLSSEQLKSIQQLRAVINASLPEGFEEDFQYNMIAYVVPLKIYPKGYHVKKNTPLPFLSLAAQKHTVNLYHNGIFMDKDLSVWFVSKHQEVLGTKPNMGKSCIRFKQVDDKVLRLVEMLVKKMSVNEFIALYNQ